MWQMIQHLKGQGHQNVGFIGGTEGLATSRIRRDSFLDAVVMCGMSSKDEWIVSGDYRVSGGESGMKAILDSLEIPTAVVTANDLTAIGALRTAHRSGLKIPDDISIAGCDDIEMADIVNPPLTTLRISRRQYAQMLFDALKISAQDLTVPGKVFTLPMKLVVRESTGPVPTGIRAVSTGDGSETATRRSR
jgi:LacI family transcriptional regulator